MTIEPCAVREWRCQACGDRCLAANYEIDNYDLRCGGCGRAYVIVDPAYARPAGA